MFMRVHLCVETTDSLANDCRNEPRKHIQIHILETMTNGELRDAI